MDDNSKWKTFRRVKRLRKHGKDDDTIELLPKRSGGRKKKGKSERITYTRVKRFRKHGKDDYKKRFLTKRSGRKKKSGKRTCTNVQNTACQSTSHANQQTPVPSTRREDQYSPEDQQLSDQSTTDACNRRNRDKCLTVTVAVFLFLTALGSGYIARVTLHILLWHISPQMESNNTVSRLVTLNRSMTPNCTNCNISTYQSYMVFDGSWTWAIFLVIIAPYCFTILRCLWQLCFNRNKQLPLNKIMVGVMTFIEFIHTVGLCILVFYILPIVGPIYASVVYLATQLLTPLIRLSRSCRNYRNETQSNSLCIGCKNHRNETHKEIVCDIVAMILQVAGISLLAYDLNDNVKIYIFLIGVIFVSVKYFENVIIYGKISSFISQLQNQQPKETYVAYSFKVIFTFIAVMSIHAIKIYDSAAEFKSLFEIDLSTGVAIFEGQTIECICMLHNPFILCAINIVCAVLCYKSSKLACTINCQILCFVIPLILLPPLTTVTFIVNKTYQYMFTCGSCDLLFNGWNLDSVSMYDLRMLIPAGVLLNISIFCFAVPILKNSGKAGRTGGVFVVPFYCGIFLELSLLKNRRRNEIHICEDPNGKIHIKSQGCTCEDGASANNIPMHSMVPNANGNERSDILCVCCATMWHEEDDEMSQLLKSLISLEKQQRKNKENKDETFDFEAHIFFDDAFIKPTGINRYVETLIKIVKTVTNLDTYKVEITPYGERLVWNISTENQLVVHLKDNDKIRNKKRWSQVMYMRYILEFKNKQLVQKFAAEDIYILALDGDVKFEPEDFLSLMRLLKQSTNTGAACGRIHPVGSGSIVWYQMFEYAIDHWLRKATEHVTGCVLCTPGCFSLFRGSSILKVLDTYSEEATKPRHYLQYDQGEDRWLCTLLLKNGMKIEYTTESNASTFVPEGFYQLYNQRRRWTPSTIANIVDLLISWKEITEKNDNISVLYISYHLCLLISTLLTPGTIFMLIVGSIIISFQWIHSFVILIVNIIVVSLFMLVCVCASTQKQLLFAAILSCIYGIVMLIGLIGVVKDAADIGFCSITTILILFEAGVFIISAILHPKEWKCLLPGLIYFFATPAMSMLMFLYALGNLHDVSWGTRETKSESESAISKSQEEMEEEKGHFCSFGKLCTCMLCPTNNYSKSEFILSILNKWRYLKDDPSVKRGQADKADQVDINMLNEFSGPGSKKASSHKEVGVQITIQENTWWIQTINSHLKPFEKDPMEEEKYLQEKQRIEKKLFDLRNKVCAQVYMLNALLIALIYSLTEVDVFTIILTINVNCSGNQIEIVPIAVLFIVVFGVLLLIQFICMIVHRFTMLVNIAAKTRLKKVN